MAFEKNACVIDALNLEEERESATLPQPMRLTERALPAAAENKLNEDNDNAADSLEQSKVPSPLSQNINTATQHNAVTWYVDMNPIEEPVDNSEKTSKKNMFDMFVELSHSEETRRNVNYINYKGLNCVKKRRERNIKYVWSPKNDLKESGFVSEHQEEGDKSQMPYPSLNISSGMNFVKLSDLDQAPKVVVEKEKIKPSILHKKTTPDMSMRRASPARISRSTGFLPIHVENSISLSRLFPNLSNELCRSVPGLVFNSRSEIHSEIENSEKSETSTQTIASSSVVIPDPFGCIENTNLNRLGEDLLRMFEQEVVTDVTIEFAGRKVGAHKCILASRCPHFASLLSGGWVESSGNTICLDGFSYVTVNFTLRYIYSGATILPENINLNELTSLADKLGLEGLKEVITLTIKDKYCHNFHKPCGLCTLGVLECLPICLTYGLEEIYQRSLHWLTEYFIEIWPTKAFGCLSTDLIEKVCHQHKVNMNPNNVVRTVCGIREIRMSLPNVRWAESVERACSSLLKASENFTSIHLTAVLKSLLDDSPPTVCISQDTVDTLILICIRTAPVIQVCKSYEYLSYVCVGRNTVGRMGELGVVKQWRRECEKVLVHAPAYITLDPIYRAMPKELQARIGKRGAPRMLDSNNGTPIRTSMHKQKPVLTPVSRSAPKLFERIYKSFTPYSPKPPASSMKTNNRVSTDFRPDTSLLEVPRRTKRTSNVRSDGPMAGQSRTNHNQNYDTPYSPKPSALLINATNRVSRESHSDGPIAGQSRAEHRLSTNSTKATAKMTPQLGNTGKSKIPVFVGRATYSSSPSVSQPVATKTPREQQRRKAGSLMSQTKSSAAKVVSKKTSNSSISISHGSGDSSASTLQRSTTFIKEEPCFPGSPDISSNK